MVRRGLARLGLARLGYDIAALLVAACFALPCLAAEAGKAAPTAESSAQTTVPPPAQVQDLLKLLQDPGVRTWLAEQEKSASKAPGKPAEAAAADQGEEAPSLAEEASARIEALQTHLTKLAAAVPSIPAETTHAALVLKQELRDRRPIGLVVLVIGFLALGYGVEWVAWRASAGLRARIGKWSMRTSRQRVRTLGMRFLVDLSMVGVFALGSIAAFLAFEWPPLLRHIVMTFIGAAVVLRLILAVARFLLVPRCAPGEEHARLLPMPEAAASFWYRRLGLFAGWFLLGWALIRTMAVLGVSQPVRLIEAYALGLGLLVIGLESIWRRPHPAAPPLQEPAEGHTIEGVETQEAQARMVAEAAEPPASASAHLRKTQAVAVNIGLTIYAIALWGLWVAGLMGAFWLAVIALFLPRVIAIVQTATHNILRPPATEAGEVATPPLVAIYIERGIRALLIAGAVLLLAWLWGVDLVELTNRDNLFTKFLRGLLSGIVIVLAADLLWQVVKTVIDNKLAHSQVEPQLAAEEAAKRAKLRTLLPIFRNITFIVLLVMAALTALAALGVEIGPLIAGAGVVGVAVGFGAQTVVKDIISGVFYLLDDAFRVGEYIVSGSHKGTVESFSLRSIRLRHHRGPIYTVPFGQLGAVQNMSRDWVIDKLTVNVTYDTDLTLAKKLIKQIGQELTKDPEYGQHILEPLKMQGLDAFGDFAIQIKLKMMTKPGEQFVIRRRALAMIKDAFDKNGIKFAYPTVQVAGGAGAAAGADLNVAAAAQETLAKLKTGEAA